MAETAREQIADVIERLVAEYTPGDYVEEWDLDGLLVAARPGLPRRLRARGARPRAHRPHPAHEPHRRRRDEALRGARGGARRRADARARALPAAADHRPALARAPLRHGLPARGHPPARLRPDRPARRLQERGLRALPGPDELHLVRLRPHDLQRRGRGAGGGRRAAARRCRRASNGARRRRGRAELLGRHARGPAERVRRRGLRRWRPTSRTRRGGTAVQQRRVDEHDQIGRNDPCWCGSGKKYKKCHGA